MAPILKELEAPTAPQSKPANETATRPQPVALEIPVTVNGARTVDGSEKRVPFSESTQTVLVFPLGAVIRIGTPLASGQLVFLTNEKTKKEVVCQVVKSKSSGSAGSYVELQFTEPAPSFWGLQIPGASAVPVAPRPAIVPTSKVPAPIAPVAKPPVAIAPPPPPAVVPAAPVASHPEPVVAAIPFPPAPVVAPPAPVAPRAIAPPLVPEPAPVKSVAPSEVAPQIPAVSVPSATSVIAPVPTQHPQSQPVPPLQDYNKQIQALFSAPVAPTTPVAPESHVAPASTNPTSEDLKQQAARLQAQLGSMLFAQTPSATPAAPAPPDVSQPAVSAPAIKQVPENTLQEPKASVPVEPKRVEHSEAKPVPPVRKPASVSLKAEDEELKIPSWLAPLSQTSETVHATGSAESTDASADPAASVNSDESYDALESDAHRRPQAAVFGGQLLGEAAAPADKASVGGSKKGVIFGLIAAAALLAGGAWYFLPHGSASAPASPEHAAAKIPSSTESAPVAAVTAAPVPSAPAATKGSAPAPSPVPAAAPPKNSKPALKNAEPEEEPAKPSLGEVHLAAPVVNHSDNPQLESESLQSVTTSSVPAGSDPFAGTSGHHNQPVVPIPIGGDVKPAELIASVPPEYPAIAKAQHVSGKVNLEAQLDSSGNVSSLKVLSGPTLLHHAALEAVKKWKYKPAMLDGEPTPSHLNITVEFRAQ
jgi:periplasmic protein TonB